MLREAKWKFLPNNPDRENLFVFGALFFCQKEIQKNLKTGLHHSCRNIAGKMDYPVFAAIALPAHTALHVFQFFAISIIFFLFSASLNTSFASLIC